MGDDEPVKWIAPVPVTIFGVSYSKGQTVPTSSWSDNQLKQQIYLGNIVADYSVEKPKSFLGDGGDWDLSKDGEMLSAGAAGAFAAPSSGNLLILSSVYGRLKSSNGNLLSVGVRIGAGATLRGGSTVQQTQSMYFRSTLQSSNEMSALVSGLTPGMSYNVAHIFTNGAGGALVSYPRIWVIPLPE